MLVSEDVIERACRGEPDAQREIYEAFFPRVYRLVRRIVGESDADDVSQDAFVQLLSKLNTFQGNSEFSTWVHRVAVNQSLQHVRSRNRHPTEMLHEAAMANQNTRATIRLGGTARCCDASNRRGTTNDFSVEGSGRFGLQRDRSGRRNSRGHRRVTAEPG